MSQHQILKTFPHSPPLTISSQFCSGNLTSARVTSHSNHSCHLVCSTSGDLNAPKYSTWFYFWVKLGKETEHRSVATAESSFAIHFTIQNMNAQKKLYKQGMKPVLRCGSSGEWHRSPEKVIFQEMDNCDDHTHDDQLKWQLKFKLSIPAEKRHKKWYIAYCFPWSVADNDKLLSQLQSQYHNHKKIYFHREVLVNSLEGRNVEVLTVSSHKGKLQQREDADISAYVGGGQHADAPSSPSTPSLYPDPSQDRAFRFPRKKCYLLTARVHPGESPASHIFNGFLKFILSPTDPRAAILRNHYVFKFVPLLNPDGVSRGHYRADTQGLNLNRFYKEPLLEEHPSIYAIKALAGYLTEHSNLHIYMDLHAHATKRGHFIFGNSLPDFEQQLENVLYSKLVALNTQHLDFHGGNFSEKSMTRKDKRDGLSKDGTGRVGMYQHTGLVHCYTLEGNYNTGRSINHIGDLPSCSLAGNGAHYAPDDLPTYTKQCPKYDIAIFEDVGKALVTALLDMTLGDANPYTRIRSTNLRNIEGVKGWTSKMMRRKKKFWKDASKKRSPIWERGAQTSVSKDESDDEDVDGDDGDHERNNTSRKNQRHPQITTEDEVVNDSDDDDNSSTDGDGSGQKSFQNASNCIKRHASATTRVVSITEHTPPSHHHKEKHHSEEATLSSANRRLSHTSAPHSPLIYAKENTHRDMPKTSHNLRRPSTSYPLGKQLPAGTVKPNTSLPQTRRKIASQKKIHGRPVVCNSVSSFERLTQPKAPRVKNPMTQSFNANLIKFDPRYNDTTGHTAEDPLQQEVSRGDNQSHLVPRRPSLGSLSGGPNASMHAARYAISDGVVFAQSVVRTTGEWHSDASIVADSDSTNSSSSGVENGNLQKKTMPILPTTSVHYSNSVVKKKKRIKKKKGSGSSEKKSAAGSIVDSGQQKKWRRKRVGMRMI